jgi:polyketide biosynthesis enoyl-CoA hydratase PksI
MSDVIKLSIKEEIAILSFEEREYKNTFTHRFNMGIIEAFKQIVNDPAVKVVIMHGYDNYFCCGGTQSELIKLHEGLKEGNKNFRDLTFYDLPLRCEVPVISAMQGHALGGGLAFGCFADIIVMGEQCIYSANFMKYGFTPGMGATYIIPKRLGGVLGEEMLYTAGNYYGYELKQRGAPVKIVDKKEVIPTAMEIAEKLTEKPLLSLKTLKKYFVTRIHSQIQEAVKDELAMHQITFVQPEVLEMIQKKFGR